jgi:hypothetical protein
MWLDGQSKYSLRLKNTTPGLNTFALDLKQLEEKKGLHSAYPLCKIVIKFEYLSEFEAIFGMVLGCCKTGDQVGCK